MIAIIVILLLLLSLAWILLFRHFRALRVASINLVRQEQREASLLHQLGEIKEKNHHLEDKLRKVQYELYSVKHREDHS
jgi:hypothetical protein